MRVARCSDARILTPPIAKVTSSTADRNGLPFDDSTSQDTYQSSLLRALLKGFPMPYSLIAILIGVVVTSSVQAAGEKAIVTAKEAGQDYAIQGEYEGATADGKKIGIQVIAQGKGKFEAVVLPGGLPGDGWNKKGKTKITGEIQDDHTVLSGSGWKGTIHDGSLTLEGPDGAKISARKVERSSPTLGAKPPEEANVLFDGSSLDAWNGGKFVEVEENKYLGVGVRSKDKFENFTLHLEFRTPYMPESRGQSRGNSGMYLLDQYECQVLDSFGLDGKDNECGGFYKVAKPDVNMCFPPLSWQTYDVEFTAAKFDGTGTKISDAVATIRHNGVVIHQDRKLPAPTPGGGQRDEKPGALFLQNHGDPVVYRNIWIVED